VYTVLRQLYEAAKIDSENKYFFILGSKLFDDSQNVKVISRPDLQQNYVKRTLFDFGIGSKFILKYHPDIVVSMQNTGILGLKNIKQYIYLHQPLPFQRSFAFRPWKKKEMKLSFYQYVVGTLIKLSYLFNKKSVVIVQSHWLRKELLIRGLKEIDKVIVTQPKLASNIKLLHNDLIVNKKNSFFYPSTAMPYKNHSVIIEALKYLTEEQRKHINVFLTLDENEYNDLVGSELPEEVKLLGRMAHKDVLELMSKSTLIFASQIESFGLPILEAKSLNRTILVNDVEVLRETVGNYDKVAYFDGDNPESLAQAMLNVIKNYENTVSYFKIDQIDESDVMKNLIEEITK